MWWVVNSTLRPFYPGNNPAPIGQEADWAPGSACTGEENLVTTGVRSTDLPARSESNFKKYRY